MRVETCQLNKDNVHISMQLIAIAHSWWKTTYDNKFNFKLTIADHINDLANLSNNEDSRLLLLLDDNDTVCGYMGLEFLHSSFSSQKIANEHYWYVRPDKRGIGSIRLFKAAKKIAKECGCSHFIMNASNLASDLHDKVCNIYERLGMKKFETSYIMEV